jgi:hypothetical protein
VKFVEYADPEYDDVDTNEANYGGTSKCLIGSQVDLEVSRFAKFRPNYFRRAVVNKRGDAFKLLRTAPKVT